MIPEHADPVPQRERKAATLPRRSHRWGVGDRSRGKPRPRDDGEGRRAVTLRAFLALALVLSALAVGLASTSGAAPAHPCVQANELWFRAGDGTKLVGHRFG